MSNHREWRGPRGKRIRKQLLAQLPSVCEICGRLMTANDELEVDHRVPLRAGGAMFDTANLRLLHKAPCHKRRRLSDLGDQPATLLPPPHGKPMRIVSSRVW